MHTIKDSHITGVLRRWGKEEGRYHGVCSCGWRFPEAEAQTMYMESVRTIPEAEAACRKHKHDEEVKSRHDNRV